MPQLIVELPEQLLFVHKYVPAGSVRLRFRHLMLRHHLYGYCRRNVCRYMKLVEKKETENVSILGATMTVAKEPSEQEFEILKFLLGVLSPGAFTSTLCLMHSNCTVICSHTHQLSIVTVLKPVCVLIDVVRAQNFSASSVCGSSRGKAPHAAGASSTSPNLPLLWSFSVCGAVQWKTCTKRGNSNPKRPRIFNGPSKWIPRS
jgi:hypothetical protein